MKQLVKAALMFIMSLSLFTAVVYAWFSIGDQTHIQPISATTTDGSPIPYEIKYYTKNNVYKHDSNSNRVLVYNTNTSTYVQQSAWSIDKPSYAFNGMFMNEYDPIIDENNIEKNVIAEITIALTGDPITLRNTILADSELASEAIALYPYTTSRPYYVSEAARVQTFISKDFNNFAEGANKYQTLNTVFNSVDINQQLVYPMFSFYQDDVYHAIMDLGSTQLTTDVTLYKLYYNFSYYESKIDEILAYENLYTNIDTMSFMVFFSDIKFTIMVGGVV